MRTAGGAARYARLADEIRAQMDSGALSPGERMPTVMEMCAKTGLSGGTVRQAYGLLRSEGRLLLTPGRGTFVAEKENGAKSRKARALEAIDGLFSALAEMGFSPAEARMFLTLRLAQRDAANCFAPVALIGDSPEGLRIAFERFSEIQGAELTAFLIDEARNAASEALTGFPLVLAPATLLNEITGILGKHADTLAPYALCVPGACTAELARFGEHAAVALYAQSEVFARFMRRAAREALPNAEFRTLLSGGEKTRESLGAADCVIAAPDFPAFAPEAEAKALQAFEKTGGTLARFACAVDEGSALSIERRVASLARAPGRAR